MIFVDPFGRAFCFPPRKTVIGIRTNLGPESLFSPPQKPHLDSVIIGKMSRR